MSDPGAPEAQKRTELNPIALGGGLRTGARWLYVFAVLACVGVSLFMALVEGRAVASAYVLAPAIGAIWFALRAMMVRGK